jgi:hypothetical protein
MNTLTKKVEEMLDASFSLQQSCKRKVGDSFFSERRVLGWCAKVMQATET